MALNILATTAACLLTYHVLVRSTLIGVFLNGHRQPQSIRAPMPAAVESK
jgi:hypothetical protein